MSTHKLAPQRVPCACWRLARELDAAISITEARPRVRLTWDNHASLFVRTRGGSCEIANAVFFDLRRHRVFGESHLPVRTADDRDCIRCRALPLDRNEHWPASTPLSVGGSMALCRDCELDLGTDSGPAGRAVPDASGHFRMRSPATRRWIRCGAHRDAGLVAGLLRLLTAPRSASSARWRRNITTITRQ